MWLDKGSHNEQFLLFKLVSSIAKKFSCISSLFENLERTVWLLQLSHVCAHYSFQPDKVKTLSFDTKYIPGKAIYFHWFNTALQLLTGMHKRLQKSRNFLCFEVRSFWNPVAQATRILVGFCHRFIHKPHNLVPGPKITSSFYLNSDH